MSFLPQMYVLAVANLPPGFTDADLVEEFSHFKGCVGKKLLKPRQAHRPVSAKIYFENEKQALQAGRLLLNYKVNGYTLEISLHDADEHDQDAVKHDHHMSQYITDVEISSIDREVDDHFTFIADSQLKIKTLVQRTSILVKNLSLFTTTQRLARDFIKYEGFIDAKVIASKESNIALGIVFFGTKQSAENALKNRKEDLVDGVRVQFQIVNINYSENTHREESTDSKATYLFISNLPVTITHEQLHSILLEGRGFIDARLFPYSSHLSTTRRHAYSCWASRRAAHEAIKTFTKYDVDGFPMFIKFAFPVNISSERFIKSFDPSVVAEPESPVQARDEKNKRKSIFKKIQDPVNSHVIPGDPCKIVVKNMPENATTKRLIALFKDCKGFKYCNVVYPKDNRPYGFINFTNAPDAKKVRINMDGTMMGGQSLALTMDQEKSSDSKFLQNGLSDEDEDENGDEDEDEDEKEEGQIDHIISPESIFCLMISGLSPDVDVDWLNDELDFLDGFLTARVVTDLNSGKSLGYGYVDFINKSNAVKALKCYQGYEINGEPITLKLHGLLLGNREPKKTQQQKHWISVDDEDEADDDEEDEEGSSDEETREDWLSLTSSVEYEENKTEFIHGENSAAEGYGMEDKDDREFQDDGDIDGQSENPGDENDDLDKNLFVGSLPDSITLARLEKEFMKYQGYKTTRIIKSNTSNVKSYAYVDFRTKADALRVFKTHPNFIDGKKINIEISTDVPNDKLKRLSTLFVGNLSTETTSYQLTVHFGDCEGFIRARMLNPSKGNSYGYVDFDSEINMRKAVLEKGGSILNHRKIFTDHADRKKSLVGVDQNQAYTQRAEILKAKQENRPQRNSDTAQNLKKSGTTTELNENDDGTVTIFVGNLHVEMTEAKLTEELRTVPGFLEARVIPRIKDNRKFGYVDFQTKFFAEAFVRGMSDHIIMGRKITLEAASKGPKKTEKLKPTLKDGYQERGSIHISNLSIKTLSETLRKRFEMFDGFIRVKILRAKYTNLSKGYGYADFDTKDQAKRALSSLKNLTLDGKKVTLALIDSTAPVEEEIWPYSDKEQPASGSESSDSDSESFDGSDMTKATSPPVEKTSPPSSSDQPARITKSKNTGENVLLTPTPQAINEAPSQSTVKTDNSYGENIEEQAPFVAPPETRTNPTAVTKTSDISNSVDSRHHKQKSSVVQEITNSQLPIEARNAAVAKLRNENAVQEAGDQALKSQGNEQIVEDVKEFQREMTTKHTDMDVQTTSAGSASKNKKKKKKKKSKKKGNESDDEIEVVVEDETVHIYFSRELDELNELISKKKQELSALKDLKHIYNRYGISNDNRARTAKAIELPADSFISKSQFYEEIESKFHYNEKHKKYQGVDPFAEEEEEEEEDSDNSNESNEEVDGNLLFSYRELGLLIHPTTLEQSADNILEILVKSNPLIGPFVANEYPDGMTISDLYSIAFGGHYCVDPSCPMNTLVRMGSSGELHAIIMEKLFKIKR